MMSRRSSSGYVQEEDRLRNLRRKWQAWTNVDLAGFVRMLFWLTATCSCSIFARASGLLNEIIE
jgi:hypothetical protein